MSSGLEGAAFAADYMYWVGIDTDPAATDDELAEFNEFYASVHFPEVLQANPGFVSATRYRLEAPDPRGDFGPQWLAVYAIRDLAGAERYAVREKDPAAQRPAYTPGPALWKSMSPRWRVMWRQLIAVGQRAAAPESIFLVGMDTPAGASMRDVEEFNAYYSDTHLPEVLLNGNYEAGTRLERYEAFLHRQPDGCPEFCAVYEGEGSAPAGPPPGAPTPGPDSWERRETAWRLRYRRVTDQVVRPEASASARPTTQGEKS
ncbi:hypothetical protein [Nocardioides sp.]|uniref:hypothetical protein n=1 Tax=Nocardioides sp. TaxID=35761 RepID=UPI003D10E549